MAERKAVKKSTKRNYGNVIKVQIILSLIICVIMFILSKTGDGNKAKEFVKRQLFESVDFNNTITDVYNKMDALIEEKVVPAINNYGDKFD